MLIIAGKLYLPPKYREKYLSISEDLLRRARAQPGCVDFIIAADPLESGRVNLFEQWESDEHLASWRAVANPPEPEMDSLDEDVQMHEISRSGPAFG